MGTKFDFVTGDTGSSLDVECIDNDSKLPIDLTGAGVKLNWRDNGGTLVSRSMSIINPLTGEAKYTFLTGEIIAPVMKFEVEITQSGGGIISSLKLVEVKVRQEVG